MKKIILKYLKSNSKKLVLIVSGFHFLGPRFGGPPKSNGGRETFERQINKYKNLKGDRLRRWAGMHPPFLSWVCVRNFGLFRGIVPSLCPMVICWTIKTHLSFPLSVFSSCSSLNSRQRSLVCALTFSFFFSANLCSFASFLVICTSGLRIKIVGLIMGRLCFGLFGFDAFCSGKLVRFGFWVVCALFWWSWRVGFSIQGEVGLPVLFSCMNLLPLVWALPHTFSSPFYKFFLPFFFKKIILFFGVVSK